MSELIRQGGIEELRNALKQHFDKVRNKTFFSYFKGNEKFSFSLFNIIYMQ